MALDKRQPRNPMNRNSWFDDGPSSVLKSRSMERLYLLIIALLALVHVPRAFSFPSRDLTPPTRAISAAFRRPSVSSLYVFHPVDTSSRPSFQLLEESTKRLLNSTHIGEWELSHFQEAQEVAEQWSRRQSKRCAVSAERLLRRVVEEQIAGNPHVASLEMSALYTAVIESWANSGEDGAPERAEEILDYMQNIYEDIYEEGDAEDSARFQPGIGAFNGVLLAYARATRSDAPQEAMRVLAKIYDWYTSGRTDVLPNKETNSIVLQSFAKSGKPDAPKVVRKLIAHMQKISETYSSVKPDYNCYNAYIASLIDSITRGHLSPRMGARLAVECLEEMMASSDEDMMPNTWTFNMALSVWSRSGEVEIVARAEGLVEALETYYEESVHSEKVQPNSNTYNCLIACYGRSKLNSKAARAHDVLRKMHKLANTGANPLAQPDTVTYNSVMNTYAKTRSRNAPFIVEELLREMDDIFQKTGDRRTKPNSRSFNTCLDAWAKSGQPGAAERILEWIEQMNSVSGIESRNALTNKWTYNAYLQALSKSGDPEMGDEAERVLDEMETLYRTGNQGLKPDVMTFTNVIHCIALSQGNDALEKALAFLNRMEDLHANGFGDIRPNLFTYNCVINCAAKSKRPGKANLALKILRRMESVALRPATASFNSVINACAFSSHDDDPKVVLQIALDALREAQDGPGANWISYQTVLRVVCTFEQDERERWHLTRDIFRKCCKDGQLTRTVLTQAKFAVSSAEYAFLRDEACEKRTGKLRDTYTANAKRSKIAPATRRVAV